MIIDNLNNLPTPVQSTDEFAVERGTTTYKMPFSVIEGVIQQSTADQALKGLSFGSHDAMIAAIAGEVRYGVTVVRMTVSGLSAGWNTISSTGIAADDRPLNQTFGTFAYTSGADSGKVFTSTLGADGTLTVYASAASSGNVMLGFTYPHR